MTKLLTYARCRRLLWKILICRGYDIFRREIVANSKNECNRKFNLNEEMLERVTDIDDKVKDSH